MGGPVSAGNSQELTDRMPARLDMVVLSGRDLPALRRFYSALGWEERPGASDSLATFDLGGTDLALYPDSSSASGATPPDEERPGMTLVVRVETPDQVSRFYTNALGAGARPVAEPQDQPWGGRSAVMADPEGNRWELLWAPGAKADRAVESEGGGDHDR